MTVYGFRHDDARALVNLLGLEPAGRTGARLRQSGGGMWIMQANGKITAGSKAGSTFTPGTGTGIIQYYDGVSFAAWQPDGQNNVELTVHNLGVAIPTGELFEGRQDVAGTIWCRALHTTMYFGQQVGALLSTDSTNGVDNLQALDGYGGDSSLTADNGFDWDADDNGVTLVVWHGGDESWLMFQVQCPT